MSPTELDRAFSAAVSMDLGELPQERTKRELASVVRTTLGMSLPRGAERDVVDNWLSGQLPKTATQRRKVLEAVQAALSDWAGGGTSDDLRDYVAAFLASGSLERHGQVAVERHAHGGKVAQLLTQFKEQRRKGNYAAAMQTTAEALTIAQEAGDATPESACELAQARIRHAEALLYCETDPENAWALADAGADPAALAEHPDLLLDALATKAEAAMATGRFKIAAGAVAAVSDLANDEIQNRMALQLRGSLALRAGSPEEAARLYQEAELSFLALLSRDPDAAAESRATIGIGSCLTNRGLALRKLGDIAAAKTSFAQAADWYHKAGATGDESVARRFLARCHFDDQEWEPGFTALADAERLAQEAQLNTNLIECLELRARALATVGNREQAYTVLTEALKIVPASDTETTRRYNQMLATLAAETADAAAARPYLDVARLLAERAADPLAITDVAHQAKELAGDNQIRHEPAPDHVINALQRQLHQSERPATTAHLMQQLAGAHRSRQNLDQARTWYQRAHTAAAAVPDPALAASALIGQAEIAMYLDDDDTAHTALDAALGLVRRIPAWEVKASALYFTGRVEARRGDIHRARQTFSKALEIAKAHRLEDLARDIGEHQQNIDEWLSLRSLPDLDFAGLADELADLEGWYPEAQGHLRRLWWYWRGDEVLKNLVTHGGAKALLVVDDSATVDVLRSDLGVLFDVTAFVTDTPFADKPRTQTFVPFPEDREFPYMNVLHVERPQGF